MKNTFIYILIDPRNDQVRYVGKANNTKQRLKNHCNPARYRCTHKFNWIKSLRKENLKPILIIIDEVLKSEWKFWERYWISQFLSWGFNLTNYTEGGDGLTYGNQTSFKKGDKSWNEGKGNVKICTVCGSKFKSPKSAKKISCSKKCASVVVRKATLNTQFNKNHKPWNTGKEGYKLKGKKKSKPVLQLDKTTNVIVTEYLGCKEAATAMGCIPENIRRACVGKSKSAKGYKWKYK